MRSLRALTLVWAVPAVSMCVLTLSSELGWGAGAWSWFGVLLGVPLAVGASLVLLPVVALRSALEWHGRRRERPRAG